MFDWTSNLDHEYVEEKRIENLIRIVENPNIPRDIVNAATAKLRAAFGLPPVR